MNWTELKDKIYFLDGSWLDIYVLNANKSDWKKWVNYVNQNYLVDWFNPITSRNENKIEFNVIEEYWDSNNGLGSTATVLVNKIQINAHFFVDSEIENDIDPREFNSIDDHNTLIKYMTDLSMLLDKEVILTPENCHEITLIKVFKSNIELSKDAGLTE